MEDSAAFNQIKKMFEIDENLVISKIWKRTKLGLPAISQVLEEEIEFDGEKVKSRELLHDDFVLAGWDYKEIMEVLEMNHRQQVDIYLKMTGQKAEWRRNYDLKRKREREKKERKKRQEKERKQQKLDTLVNLVLSLAGDDLPLRNVVKETFQKQRRKNSTPLETKLMVYRYCSQLIEEGRTETHREITKAVGLGSEMVVHRMIKGTRYAGAVNHYQNEVIVLSRKERERVKKIEETMFSSNDASYFMRFSAAKIYNRLGRLKDYAEQAEKYGIRKFSYAKASQIYEGLDKGRKKERVRKKVGVSEEVYQKYLGGREEISREIVEGLKILYPEVAEGIVEPYRNEKVRYIQQKERQKQVVADEVRKAITGGAVNTKMIRETTGYAQYTINRHAKKELGRLRKG